MTLADHDALRERLARWFLAEAMDPQGRSPEGDADAVLALPELAPLLAKAESAERVAVERDEARRERDDLKTAAGFNPGPFRTELSRKVILDDIAGMRPAMVKARQEARNVEGDALLWNMRMLEEWPGDTLLLRLWRQRREATKAARAAQAEIAQLSAEIAALRAALEPFAAICEAEHMRHVRDEQVLEVQTRAEVIVSEKLRGQHFRTARAALRTDPPAGTDAPVQEGTQ